MEKPVNLANDMQKILIIGSRESKNIYSYLNESSYSSLFDIEFISVDKDLDSYIEKTYLDKDFANKFSDVRYLILDWNIEFDLLIKDYKLFFKLYQKAIFYFYSLNSLASIYLSFFSFSKLSQKKPNLTFFSNFACSRLLLPEKGREVTSTKDPFFKRSLEAIFVAGSIKPAKLKEGLDLRAEPEKEKPAQEEKVKKITRIFEHKNDYNIINPNPNHD
jgi:hypothetical protein